VVLQPVICEAAYKYDDDDDADADEDCIAYTRIYIKLL
jgi:hypothetical protein